MGKKTIVWAYLLILSLGTILSLYIPKDAVAAKDAIIIPGQAIRLRILANSDLNSDQELKRKVRDSVNAKISVWVKDLTSIKKARDVIESKLPELKATAEKVVKENGSNETVQIKFGEVQFPTKLYGQFLYPAGEYEAVLITLGKGAGANWWCVLFPPLCFLDFSNGVAVSQGFDEQKAKPQPSSGPKAAKDLTKPNLPQTDPGSRASGQDQAGSNSGANEANSESNSETGSNELNSTTSSPPAGSSNSGTAASSISSQIDTASAAPAQTKSTDRNAAADVSKSEKQKKKAPVYITQDDQPIKVKFFIVELWKKLF